MRKRKKEREREREIKRNNSDEIGGEKQWPQRANYYQHS